MCSQFQLCLYFFQNGFCPTFCILGRNFFDSPKFRWRGIWPLRHYATALCRVSKNSQNCFSHNFVKFSPTLIIFSTNMPRRYKTKLCKVDLFFTSPNLCQCTTMWNSDAPNCYISRWLFVSDCPPLHHQFNIRCHVINFINFVVLNILRWK